MAETLTTLNAFGLIGGAQGKQEWWKVKLKSRVVVYPKDGERRIGEIDEEVTVSKGHAIELLALDRAALLEKQETKKIKEKENV